MDDKKKRQSMIVYLIIAIALAIGLRSVLYPSITQSQVEQVTYSKFIDMVDDGDVKTVKLNTGDNTIKFTTDDSSVTYETTEFPNDSDLVKRLQKAGVTFSAEIPDQTSDMWLYLALSYILPIAIIFGGGWLLNRRLRKQMGDDEPSMNFGSGFGMGGGLGRSNAKEVKGKETGVTFKDVAGQDEAKESLQEIVNFLSHPEKYAAIGARCPRGALLVGPPGTGKTLLAKAVAGEADVPFFQISGSEFVEMFVGRGAAKVRDLFKQAKEKAPCIVFIDEIDTIGKKRGMSINSNDEREQTLNQLLVEMDGFDDNSAVILIAATNRPDILDPALLRPGRFDRQITVDRPDVKGRQKILTVHSKNKPLATEMDLSRIAKLTPGFTGADLANLMNESALLAARRHKELIGMAEVEESMERVIAGPEKKGRVMSEKERNTIAFHESGHALVGHILENSDPVHKIGIISRGRALGYTMQLPEEDHFLETRDGMLDQIAVLLGGRTAEELFCDDITTGASNDLERATKIARSMVTVYGMSDELGAQVFSEPQHEVFLGRDYTNHHDLSAETSKRIDDEVERIMREAHQRAHDVLSARDGQMRTMARVLLARETVEGDAVNALLDNKWDEYVAKHPEEAEDVATPAAQDEAAVEAVEKGETSEEQ